MAEVTKQLCEHLSHMDASQGVQPAAVVACAPLLDRNSLPFSITEKEVVEVIRSALQVPIEPLIDTQVHLIHSHIYTHTHQHTLTHMHSYTFTGA